MMLGPSPPPAGLVKLHVELKGAEKLVVGVPLVELSDFFPEGEREKQHYRYLHIVY